MKRVRSIPKRRRASNPLPPFILGAELRNSQGMTYIGAWAVTAEGQQPILLLERGPQEVLFMHRGAQGERACQWLEYFTLKLRLRRFHAALAHYSHCWAGGQPTAKTGNWRWDRSL